MYYVQIMGLINLQGRFNTHNRKNATIYLWHDALRVSKYEVISGLYSVRIQENTDQK